MYMYIYINININININISITSNINITITITLHYIHICLCMILSVISVEILIMYDDIPSPLLSMILTIFADDLIAFLAWTDFHVFFCSKYMFLLMNKSPPVWPFEIFL